MAFVKNGYVHQQTSTNHHKTGKTIRDWFFVAHKANRPSGLIQIHTIHLPPHYVGKKIKLKVEVKT